MSGADPAVVVYWRPGCGFCARLLRALDKAGVTAERRNIWEDDDARQVVRSHNRGNETVPTVVLSLGPDGGPGEALTNPDPGELVRRLADERPDLVARPDAGGGGWRDRLRLT